MPEPTVLFDRMPAAGPSGTMGLFTRASIRPARERHPPRVPHGAGAGFAESHFLCLVVKCPNGAEWMIDSRASNCTLPDDNEHRCWVRHGEPPDITVDKNGLTCAAGAGSIQARDYHGFLRNGEFTP